MMLSHSNACGRALSLTKQQMVVCLAVVRGRGCWPQMDFPAKSLSAHIDFGFLRGAKLDFWFSSASAAMYVS